MWFVIVWWEFFFLLIYPFSKSCLDSMSKLNFKNTNITLKEESLHTLRCQSFTVRITIRIIIWKTLYTTHYLLISKCSWTCPLSVFYNLTRESMSSSLLCWFQKDGLCNTRIPCTMLVCLCYYYSPLIPMRKSVALAFGMERTYVLSFSWLRCENWCSCHRHRLWKTVYCCCCCYGLVRMLLALILLVFKQKFRSMQNTKVWPAF